MLDLDRHLHRYAGYLDEIVEPVEIPVIEPDRAPAWLIRSGRLVPALGAAILLILAIGMLVVLGPFRGDETPLIEEPTTASTLPATTDTTSLSTTVSTETNPTPTTQPTSTAALPEPPAISWTRIADPSIFGGERAQAIHAVTVVADCSPEGECGPMQRLVAVGEDRSGTDDFTFDAAVWVSEDRFTWRRVAHDESVLGGDQHEVMLDVTGNGSRVVAVGAVQAGTRLARSSIQAAIWLSDDLGETWRRSPFGSDQSSKSLSTVVPLGSGFLAGGDGFWVSDDGETWASTGPEDFAGYVERIVRTPGGWLALGAPPFLGLWTSTNGYDWNPVELGVRIGDVAVTPDGLVGFGELPVGDMGSRPAAWQSAEGSNWSILNDNLTGGDTIHYHRAEALVPVGDWLLAAGNQQTRAGNSRPRLYMSPDQGRSWLELEIADTFGELYDPISAVYDVMVLTGDTGQRSIVMVGVWGGNVQSGPHDGAVWIGNVDD